MRKGLVVLAVSTLLAGCQANPYTGEEELSNTTTRGAAGVAVGAAIGAGVGAAASKGDAEVTLLGAAIGGLLGGLIGASQGQELDRQEALLREKLQAAGVSVDRRGDNIVLNLAQGVSFAPGETTIDGKGQQILDAIKEVLVEFDDTTIDVFGYTDNQGNDVQNRSVSLERARNVALYLQGSGVSPDRLRFHGVGDADPIAPNDTPEGRAANRRVELHIAPVA